MKISPINGVSNFTKIKKLANVNNSHSQNNIGSNSYVTNIYEKRDLVPFKSAVGSVDEKFFQLPEGCHPDKFQVEAAKALNEGKNVLVEAPTGTGKTAIAHYIASKNMAEGKTTFYTTPLKALSNQKLNEFRKVYGDENVGILTGDRRENADAPVVIMTTEVYRNMALSEMYGEKNPIMEKLGTVIFDEFHYLGDSDRGPVWEESMMYTPKGVQTLGLSATIGNPKDLIGWIGNIEKKDSQLVSIPPEARAVPLKFDSIPTGAYRAEERRIQNRIKKTGTSSMGNEEDSLPPRPVLSDFKFAIDKLNKKEQLPAIFFVFSKDFSRDLVEYFSEEGADLTTKAEKEEIDKIVRRYKAEKYIGSDLDEDALRKGYAIHNAGIMPQQKELIEELFQKKLVKAVIATETLAAGINMPAKTVVISYPYKPSDEVKDEEMNGMRLLTVNEYKQMSGRAGRRGIDEVGYVYTMPTSSSAEQDFLMMESLNYDSVKSKYNPDYAFITGYYQHNDNESGLKEVFNKSFYAYSPDEKIKQSKIDTLLSSTDNKTKVLEERGFLENNDGKISPTLLGDMAAKVRGYDALTLVELINDKAFKDMNPEALTLVAAAMANPARPNENALGVGDDISDMFDNVTPHIDMLYDQLKRKVSDTFKKLGMSTFDFSGYQSMLDYAKSIESPNSSSVDEVKAELDRLTAIKAKLNEINQHGDKMSYKEIEAKLKQGRIVSTWTLEECLRNVETYKKRNHVEDISEMIQQIKDEIAQAEVSGKGNKAKEKLAKKIQSLNADLEEAKVLKYLDDNLVDKLSENYKYTREHSTRSVKQDLAKISTLYTQLTAKDTLVSAISGLMSIEDYCAENDIETENIKNFTSSSGALNAAINKGLDIYQTEEYHGIDNKPERYSKIAAQNVYTWAMLNKVNHSTMPNWKEMLEINGDETDEGSIFRQVMQTADFISQIGEIASVGEKECTDAQEREYYTQLRKTAYEARKLLIQEPVIIQ